MVQILGEKKSLRSIAGKNFPNFEMLDAKIASALNNIIPKSHFMKKVSLEEQKVQKGDRFLRGRQIAFMIFDFFLAILDYAHLFCIFGTPIFRNSIRDGMKFYYLGHQLKTVLELYDMEIEQKVSMPNYQKLETMVKEA